MKKFAHKLDQLRRPQETKKEFARRIGVSPVQLSRYYSGTTPGWKVTKRIAERTGASLEWLLSEEIEGWEARRVGAKVAHALTDEDRLSLALSYLEELKGLNREERETLKEIVFDLTRHTEHLHKLSAYLRFLRFEDQKKKNKILTPT